MKHLHLLMTIWTVITVVWSDFHVLRFLLLALNAERISFSNYLFLLALLPARLRNSRLSNKIGSKVLKWGKDTCENV